MKIKSKAKIKTPNRFSKSLLEQSYIIMAHLEKSKLFDDDLMIAMAKHLNDCRAT